jgi:DNA repair protein RecO (recombination protein O)
MLVSTDAIVLKSMKFKETSRIVTAYTELFGKVSVLAKGARGSKSKFGAALQPLSLSHLVLYKKDNRDLQLLSQADLVMEFRGVVGQPFKTALGFVMIEYVNAVVQGEERQPKLYRLLRTALETLDASRQHEGNALLRFLLDLSASEGYGIDFDQCVACRRPLADIAESQVPLRFDSMDGGFYCPQCSGPGAEITQALFRSLRWLDTAAWDTLDRLAMPQPAFHRAVRILHTHVASHHPDMRQIRSYALLDVFSQDFNE